MAKKDSIQTKYNFTDKQIKNLDMMHQEMKKYEDTPDELGAFVSMLADNKKGEKNIKMLHEHFKEYPDTPDDIDEFKSLIGFKKKSVSSGSSQEGDDQTVSGGRQDQQGDQPVTRVDYASAIEDVEFDQDRTGEKKKDLASLEESLQSYKFELNKLEDEIVERVSATKQTTGYGVLGGKGSQVSDMREKRFREDASQDKIERYKELKSKVEEIEDKVTGRSKNDALRVIGKLKNRHDNERLELESKQAELEELEKKYTRAESTGYGVLGGKEGQVSQFGGGPVLNNAPKDVRNKIQGLRQEIDRRTALLNNASPFIRKAEQIAELAGKPENFSSFGTGFLNGVSNYFRDYANVINQIAGKKRVEALQEKVARYNKNVEEKSEKNQDLIKGINRQREQVDGLKSEVRAKVKSAQDKKEKLMAFDNKKQLSKEEVDEYNRMAREYNVLHEEIDDLQERVRNYTESINEKVDEYNAEVGVEFTDDEMVFLQAINTNRQIVSNLKDKVPDGADVGQSVGQSLAFMGEFALTAGVGKGIMSGAKGGLKVAAKKAAQAGVQTLTMPTFIKDAAKGISMDKQKDVKAVWDAYYDTLVETFSERLFMGTLPKAARGNVVNKALNRMGNALANKKGATGVLKGMVEEMLEEEFALFAHSVKKEDSMAGVMRKMGNLEEQGKTLAAVAVMSGAFGSAQGVARVGRLANNARAGFKLKRAGNKLDKEAKDYIDAALEDENSSFEDINQAINEIGQNYAAQDDVSSEEAKQRFIDVWNYASWKMRDVAYKERAEAQKEEQKQEGQQQESTQQQGTQEQTEEPSEAVDPLEVVGERGYDQVLERADKGEPINENELDNAIDEIFTTIEEVKQSENISAQDKQAFEEVMLEEAEKLDNYENQTTTETRKIAQEKTSRTVKRTPKKTEPKETFQEKAVGKQAVYRDNEGGGATGTFAVEETPDGKEYYTVQFKNQGGETSRYLVGEKGKLGEPRVEYDSEGNPASVTFDTQGGKQVTVKDTQLAEEVFENEVKKEEFDEDVFEETFIEFTGEEQVEVKQPRQPKATTQQQTPKVEAASGFGFNVKEQEQEQEQGQKQASVVPEIKKEITEDQEAFYQIGEQTFNDRQEFIAGIEKYKGQENVPEIEVKNDNVAVDRATRILKEGLQQEQEQEQSQEQESQLAKSFNVRAKNQEKHIMSIEVPGKGGKKTKAQAVREARDGLKQFIKDNRKELKKVSGRAVPTMLNKVNNIKTEKSFNSAVEYINKYLKNQQFREQETKRRKQIDNIKSEVSSRKLTESTQQGTRKAKKKGEVFAGYIDRAKRIGAMVPGSVSQDKGKLTEKYERAIEAEIMLEEGRDLQKIADHLNMTQETVKTASGFGFIVKASSNLEDKINRRIDKDQAAYDKVAVTEQQADETASRVYDVIESIEAELRESDPSMRKIKGRLSDVGERIEKAPEDMSISDVEAALNILKQDLQFYGLENMSAEEVSKRAKEFEEIKTRTFEDVKAEIEERNKQFEKRIKEVLSQVDPSDRTVLTSKELKQLRDIHDTFTSHLGMRNFWAALDRIDMTSKRPMDGDLVRSFIQTVRGGEKRHEKISMDFYNDLDALQKEVFGNVSMMKLMKELQVAPGRPGETFTDKIGRYQGNVQRVVTEKVYVTDENGNQLYYTDRHGKQQPDFLPLNQMVAAKKWLELQDPSLEETFFSEVSVDKQGVVKGMGYTRHHVRTIENYLRDDVKQYAYRIMNELLPKYYDVFNATYRKLNGVDLPKNQFYSPIFRDTGEETIDTDVLINKQGKFSTVNNGHIVERKTNTNQLLYVDLQSALQSYIKKMAHYTAYAEPVKEISKVFKYSNEVKEAVKQRHGKRVLEDITRFVDDLSDNNRYQEFKIVDKVRKNFIFASLALKGNQIFKQFASVGAGIDYLGVDGFYQAMRDFAKNPQKAKQMAFQNPVIKRRLEQGNFDPDAALSLARDWTKSGKTGNWKNKMMLPTKWGDMGPIVALYPKYYEKALKEVKEEGYTGDEAHDRAENIATHHVLTWQQSTFMSDLSGVQRQKGLARMLVMYATSPLSYHRKAYSGFRHMWRNVYFDSKGAHFRDKGAFFQGAKAFFIGHVLLPQMFIYALNGFRWDDEDQLRALAIGNLQALPMTGPILQYSANKIMDLPFDFQMTPLTSLVKDVYEGIASSADFIERANKEEEKITEQDIFEVVDHVGGSTAMITGMPWGGFDHVAGIRYWAKGYNTDMWEGIRRGFGWTEWQITPNKAILDGTERQVMYSIMKDESIATMLQRIRDERGVKHLRDNMADYVENYIMRKRFDPTYTDDMITDILMARNNRDKIDALLSRGKHMTNSAFNSMVAEMSVQVPIPSLNEDFEYTSSKRSVLLSEEVKWRAIGEHKGMSEEEAKQFAKQMINSE